MLIEYSVLRHRTGGPEVAQVRMRDGVISWECRSDRDRLRIEPYLRDTTPFPRNLKFEDDRSEYMAIPGTRTWLEETIEQRLYYREGYGYMIAVVPPTSAYLILTASPMTPSYRGLHRDHFNESTMRRVTRTPALNALALRRLLSVWEEGLSENGLIERAEDAEAVYAMIEDPEAWELVYSCPPGDGRPSGDWMWLGIDVAEWVYGIGNASVFSELDVDDVSINVNGLVPDEHSGQRLLDKHAEELAGYELREVWVRTS